jgi:hypothetical protein
MKACFCFLHKAFAILRIAAVIMLSGSCILLADKMGIQITTSSGLECASILMSKPDALKLFPPDSMPTRKNFSYYDMGEYSCIIECQLMPNLRY